MVGEQPGGVPPVPGGLGVPDRVDDVPVLRVPRGRGPVQPADGVRVGPAQLQAQQVGEEVVVAEPRPPGVERDDERVRLLERVQDRAPSRRRRTRASASAPFTRSRIEVRSSSRRTSSGWRSSTSASR